MSVAFVGKIYEHFEKVTDPRVNGDCQETREVAALPVPSGSCVFAKWAGLRTIGGIYRPREIDGHVEESQEFFITSPPCQVRKLTKHLRMHWSIENSRHHAKAQHRSPLCIFPKRDVNSHWTRHGVYLENLSLSATVWFLVGVRENR